MDRNNPPDTRRYCTKCEKITLWKYKKDIGHSRCCQCEGRYSYHPKNIKGLDIKRD